mmetsp:Transcript_81081/g.224364  ORF Transcript_81081/g.224364 Transcript_81081/m.224364 type:complete len:387 (-) Transcript_81081:90-1250(-)|eukprot:CAMPEP_0179090128 /NCGR_PEP_ID=MMETSP0796-20121207/41103_1 /TAXON_ID=73915 /ORGANISM="Pyrodinium bahamense, Strain pbaha01" /LENGTH=386 /DNA_ID=CAMNT_0020787695 /DNA_START=21 /DNA_END=1181 /DNA_ORIENTATION=+
MADILNGTSGHSSFAPLSQAQTLSIAKHLQEQIDDLGSKCDTLSKDLQHATESIKAVATQLNNYSVDDLRENVTSLGAQVVGLRGDLGRTNNNLQKLTHDHDATCETLSAVRDGQQVSNTKMQKIVGDLEQVAAKARDLKTVLETKVNVEAQQLRDELSKTNHRVDLINQDMPVLKAGLQNQKEALHDTQNDLQALTGDLAMTNTNAGMLEQKMSDLSASLREAKQNLSDTDTALTQLREDHGLTKDYLNTTNGNLKKTGTHVKQVSETLNRTMNELRSAKAKLDCTSETLDIARKDLEGEKAKVKSLRDSQDRVNATQGQLASQLEETSAVLNETRMGLKETNSLVLPNLQLDSTFRGGFGMSDGRAATARGPRLKPLSMAPKLF